MPHGDSHGALLPVLPCFTTSGFPLIRVFPIITCLVRSQALLTLYKKSSEIMKPKDSRGPEHRGQVPLTMDRPASITGGAASGRKLGFFNGIIGLGASTPGA